MQVPDLTDIEIPGDSEAHIMGRTGHCVALTKTRAVYRFGFRPGSIFAEKFGVSTAQAGGDFVWVLWDTENGKELARHNGPFLSIPARFKTIFEKPYEYVNGNGAKKGGPKK